MFTKRGGRVKRWKHSHNFGISNVLILRGISGSGKSTYANSLNENGMIVSADDYFINEKGVYEFDSLKLKKAHDSCLRGFVFCLENVEENIIVDNTNLSLWEMESYIRLAKLYWAVIQILTIPCSVDAAYARNVHKVPLETITRQEQRRIVAEENWPYGEQKKIILESTNINSKFGNLSKVEKGPHG